MKVRSKEMNLLYLVVCYDMEFVKGLQQAIRYPLDSTACGLWPKPTECTPGLFALPAANQTSGAVIDEDLVPAMRTSGISQCHERNIDVPTPS